MDGMLRRLIQKIGTDKIAHAAVSAFLTLALALGIAKEYLDGRTGGSFDKKDLLADALGVLAGTLILII